VTFFMVIVLITAIFMPDTRKNSKIVEDHEEGKRGA
jgi:hypothetical protein